MDTTDSMDGKIIITIAILTHGGVIDLELNERTQTLFENVRLFVKAEGYGSNCMNDVDKVGVLQGMYSSFRKSMRKNTLSVLNKYAGRLFDHVTIDKIYRVEKKGFWDSVGLGEVFGVYLISIHKKVQSEYQLVWPPRGKIDYNVDLLRIANVKRLIELFYNKDYVDTGADADTFIRDFLYDASISLGRDAYFHRIEEIERTRDLSEKEKARLISVEDNAYLHHLQNDFRLEVDRKLDEIVAIRLSFLIALLRKIVGENSAFNVMDYSCHRIFPAIKDRTAASYLTESDIENPPPYSRQWGGLVEPRFSTFSTFKKGGAKSTFKKGGAKSTFKKGRAKSTFKKGRAKVWCRKKTKINRRTKRN